MRKGNLTRDILSTLFKVGFFTIAATSPYFLHRIVKEYFKDLPRKREATIAKKLRELEKKKIVSFLEMKDGSVRIELSHQGKLLVRQYKLDEIKIDTNKKWDYQWRLVIYDIPHYNKKARDAFRGKLKQLGLQQLQKSVWVSAYDCLAEIEFLCAVFNVNFKNILYITTVSLPGEKALKERFHLS